MKTTNPLHTRFPLLTKQAAAFLFFALLVLLNSCQKNANDLKDHSLAAAIKETTANLQHPAADAQMVLTWNEAGTIAFRRMGALPPMPESRVYAMINVAMHDALNTISPQYARYALTDAVSNSASPDASVAQAAHDVIAGLLPPQQGYADSLLAVSLASIADGDAKTKGIDLGKAAALAMLTARANDGAAVAQYDIAQGTLPGEYRSTPPFDLTGFMGVPGWGKIVPFALLSDSQFRAPPPYKIRSVEYTEDFNEMKKIGGAASTKRTADQTQIALFWLPNAPFNFNNITRTLIAQKNITDAWAVARLLALVQMAEADANISCFDAKYHYFFWRPYTAIHLADTDGNPLTKGDTTWQPLAPPTPPVPDYPSNHACGGAAAATVMIEFFHQNEIHFTVTSTYLQGVTRSFKSLSDAARENALSRIYVGYHFRLAVDKGEEQGAKVGNYVYNHALQPL